MRSAWIAMSPSFRFGRNSLPRREASTPHSTTNSVAPASTSGVRRNAPSSSGSYRRLAQSISRFSFSDTLLPMNRATAAGTKVTDKIIAPSKASTTATQKP
ncbi:hypothetical protein G6F57_019959 [Rhizopus arrhizus]|nr:hypothetical protein G6F57_019959 [Rhizopus arrhizus]